MGKLEAGIGRFTGPGRVKPQAWVNFVGFVPIVKNTSDADAEKLVVKAPADIPDPLLDRRLITVPAGKSQPVWITVFVPEGVRAGIYTTALRITGDGKAVSVPVRVRVSSFVLPEERTLKVTNWFHSWNLPPVYRCEKWGEEHWRLLKSLARVMAEHRQAMCCRQTGRA